MRTLKKTLCLVLCLAMMAGLCCVAASADFADFTDKEEITYKEAVDVLYGLGIINGMTETTFVPDGTLTRAQAAKIICLLLDAGDIKATCNFEDCQGHWAANFIAYCAAKGIVNGVGDNKFNPEGKLTGSAWAKMLLVALGYSAENAGMTGADWEVGVASLVKSTKLAAGVKGFDATAEITRDEACELAFTALTIPMVAYTSSGVTIKTDDVEIIAGASDAYATGEFLGEGLKVVQVVADKPELNKNYQDDNGLEYYTYYKTGDAKKTAITDKYYTDTVIGEFDKDNTLGDILKAAGLDLKKLPEDLVIETYENGVKTGEADADVLAGMPAAALKEKLPAGCTMELAVNEDGTYKLLETITFVVEANKGVKVTNKTDEHYGEYAYTFGLFSDAVVYDKNDKAYVGFYAVVPAGMDFSCEELLSVEKVTPIEAKAAKYTTDDYGYVASVTVEGVTYPVAAVADDIETSDISFTKTLAYYVYDGVLYVVGEPETEVAEKTYAPDGYCYVEDMQIKYKGAAAGDLFTDATASACAVKAKVVFTDSAKEQVIDLKVVSKTVAGVTSYFLFDEEADEIENPAEDPTINDGLISNIVGMWWGYNVEDGVYTLVWDSDYATDNDYAATKKQATTVSFYSSDAVTNSATVYTYINVKDGTVKTVTGIANIAFAEQRVLAVRADAKAKTVSNIYFVDFTAEEVADEAATYAYIAEVGATTANGQEVTAYIGGEVVTLYMKDVNVYEGCVYENLKYDTKNVITDYDDYEGMDWAEEVTLVDDTFFQTQDGSYTYYFGKDCKTYNITTGTPGTADTIEEGDYVCYVYDYADGEYTALVIYIVDAPSA